MIFIPFFKKIDWSNPPLVTLLLILINCLIYFTFQTEDESLIEKAFEFYVDSDLPEMEIPLYVEHLTSNNQWQLATEYRDYLDTQTENPQTDDEDQKIQRMLMIAPMKMDADFNQQLQQGKLFTDEASRQKWQTLNAEYESRLHQVTTYQYGLKPNDPTLLTLFSNLFLHGGFGHLLGNMIFLFIIGFVVETALGKIAYSSGYILAGLCGSLLYVVASGDSQIPTVGASGAIAGLMGMYTVLFGLRKINFFYFVFVYFDYVKAPAIVLLPIWLGHELFQLMVSSSDGVNYYAHIGGLCSGALFAFILKHYLNAANFDYLDQDKKAQQNNEQFETALDYLAKIQVDKALNILRPLSEEHPANQEYLLQWYKAAKLRPGSDDFHVAAKKIMTLNDKNPQTYLLAHNTYQEYVKLAQPKVQLNVQLCIHLVSTFARGRYFDDAEKLLKLIGNHKQQNTVAETTLILANAFQKANQHNKCTTYLKLIINNYQNSTAAIEASRRLKSLQGEAS